MAEDLSKREKIKRAEELILLLRDIRSCRISTDEDDEITEIHVVADGTAKSPKLIARDVEGCLKAELGLDVDHRKIGVVVIDSDPDAPGVEEPAEEHPSDESGEDVPSDEAEVLEETLEITGPEGREGSRTGLVDPPELEFLEEDVRIRFKGLKIEVKEDRVEVSVAVEKNGLGVNGEASGERGCRPFYKLIAAAALDAVSKLIDERIRLCLAGIEKLVVSGREAMVASVKILDGRRAVYLSGSAFIGDDANEAAALSVLDAVNRPFGRWKSRRQVHYRIR